MYSYDRRAAASSATPGLDAVAKKDHSSKLKSSTARAMRAADKAEDLVEKGNKGKWRGAVKEQVLTGLKKAAEDASKAAYAMLDALRPAISSKELAATKGLTMDVAKQSRMLIESLQKLDTGHYAPVATLKVTDRNVHEVPKTLHDLAMQMDTVEKVYKQFRAAY